MSQQMTGEHARQILGACAIPINAEFHSLHSSVVSLLLEYADDKPGRPYKAPKNANGSRARYWLAYLQRRAQRTE